MRIKLNDKVTFRNQAQVWIVVDLWEMGQMCNIALEHDTTQIAKAIPTDSLEKWYPTFTKAFTAMD